MVSYEQWHSRNGYVVQCLQHETQYYSMISSFQFKYAEKGKPEIQEVSSTQFSYEWFGLGFTGVMLPSLARRASIFCHPEIKNQKPKTVTNSYIFKALL